MRATLKRLGWLVLVAVACAWLLAVAALFVFQRQLVFPGALRPVSTDPLPFPTTTFEAGGERCLQMTAGADPEAPVVAYFHGNGETLRDIGPALRRFAASGFEAIALEYPGYGGAPGAPSEASIVACTGGLAARLVSRKVFVVGHSLGSGPAAVWASSWPLERLVLLAPYTSLVEMGRRTAPWMPVSLLMHDRFDTLARAPSIHVPTLVVHGTADEVIPYELGRDVARAIPGARLVTFRGGDHYPLDPAFEEVLAFLAAPRPPP